MRRVLLPVSILAAVVEFATLVSASDTIFSLTGWAEIPSTFRRAGPVSGQFATGANGVMPPYAGQPIPGFSGIIPSRIEGRFLGLPDNGFGAQGNSADFVIGFYEFTPVQDGWGWHDVARPVTVHGYAVQRPERLPGRLVHPGGRWPTTTTPACGPDSCRRIHQRRSAADRGGFRRRVHCTNGRRHVLGRRGVRPVPLAFLGGGTSVESAGPPPGAPGAAEPDEHPWESGESSELTWIRVADPQR